VGAWRRVRPTVEGAVFLATMAAVALAALNTGNNLLYLVFAAMLALLALSGVLSESSIRGLAVERRLAGRAFAGEPVAGSWTLINTRRVPGLAVRVEELPGKWAELSDHRPALFPYLAGRDRARRPGRWVFERRGRHRLERVRISTTWPFGILRKWYEIPLEQEVLVFPPRASAVAEPAGGDAIGEAPSRRGGRGDGDLMYLRDHRAGEELGRIHWKSTARLGRRVVAERERPGVGLVDVRLARPAGQGVARARAFEADLADVTGALCAAVDAGHPVRLAVFDAPTRRVRDSAARDAALGDLAILPLPDEG